MNLKYTVSIKNDSNKIISSSDDKFAGISIGSLIKLENDPKLHCVSQKDSFFFIKAFESQDSKILVINDDIDINLQKYDTIKITYKEYEAKFLIDILNKGASYSLGTKINVKGGILSFDLASGSCQPTVLSVSEINEKGGIEGLSIVESGKYIAFPEGELETISDRGNGLTLNIKYSEISNRSFLERTITDIYYKDGKTFIILDYSLPPNLLSGKISCEKNIIYLSSNYLGETQKNIRYEIFSHFTPNIKLPMLLKNSMSSEIIYNKSCLIIDEEIGKIKKHLGIK